MPVTLEDRELSAANHELPPPASTASGDATW